MDDMLAELEAEEVREFDGKLVVALLTHAGRVGELRLSAEDAHWFLKFVGYTSWLLYTPNRVMTPNGPVPFIVEGS